MGGCRWDSLRVLGQQFLGCQFGIPLRLVKAGGRLIRTKGKEEEEKEEEEEEEQEEDIRLHRRLNEGICYVLL